MGNDDTRSTATTALAGRTVMLVEDSRYAADAARLLLRALGARIRRAESLAQAHRHLALYRPDLALIDLGLPDGSGLSLITCLDMLTPRPRIVAISGYPEDAEQARAAGADAFLAKPFDFRSFVSHVVAGPDAELLRSRSAVAPDPMALRDDLTRASLLLESASSEASLRFATRFLGGVARSAGDLRLAAAAAQAACPGKIAALGRALRARIDAQPRL